MNQTQLTIFSDRYALKDASGNQLEQTPTEMYARVAESIATTASDARDYYDVMNRLAFLPGGRILAGAGAEAEKTFYNCFVIPVETESRRHNRNKQGYHSQREDAGSDSREAIFDTIKTMVDIMSRGGGVGINWSVLRPSGSYLNRISGTSSGPVGWMDVASAAVGEVIQGGSRRGAAMFMLDDWHPDVWNFIEAKTQKDKITNANISVSVSDAFMEAVRDDKDWELVFPDTTDPEYNTEWTGDLSAWKAAGRPVITHSVVKARAIWQGITESAWKSGEPGVVFLDRYNKQSTAGEIERIICVNPCGEQGLGAYSVCNLGAMNLAAYVELPRFENEEDPRFLFEEFAKDVRTAIRFLDDVIDKNYYFLPETEAQQKKLRRIGLSVMGLADALVMLGIRYGSPESVKFVEDVFRTMKVSAIQESNDLAQSRGPAEGWSDSMWKKPYLFDIQGVPGIDYKAGLRNLFLLTQAPTGTTSLLAGVNSGIEPYFNIRPYRVDRTGERHVDNVALAAVIGDDPKIPPYVVTSEQISVEEHVAIQSAVQKYVDSSVSKTINAPKDQTPEETMKAFELAWRSDLKGLAYYRDGSRSVQVLYHESPNETIAKLEAKVKELSAKLAFKERSFVGFEGFVDTKWPNFPISEMPTFGQDLCPDCLVGTVVYEEGCKKCEGNDESPPCGWSAC
jgi:ribonucleoside-diphosphate reductase alpha chain